MTILTTPDPDAFRDTVNNTRKYTGGVLGDTRWDSVTSLKPPKAFKGRTPWGTVVSLDALRAAVWVAENLSTLDSSLGKNDIIEAVATSPDQALQQASGRGTRVHDSIAERILSDG